MGWSTLATQFCLELAFGVLVAMAFVPRAPVGALFYRIMGSTALLPLLCATLLPVAVGGVGWSRPAILAGGIAVVSYPLYSGPYQRRGWWLGLGLAIAGCGLSLALVVQNALLLEQASWWQRSLATLSAMATGTVAGSVGLAMVLGHWYLTIPNLQLSHLARLNCVSVVSMLAASLCLVATLLAFSEAFSAGTRPVTSPFGLFYLGTRTVVGILLPLLFAWMSAQSLRYQNTRSATGILYASTVIVLIGTAVSIALQDTYGVPL
jgi:hypothetical protein